MNVNKNISLTSPSFDDAWHVIDMDPVRRARARLSQYPTWIAECSAEATIYAKCVINVMGGVKKDQCAEEFRQFKHCFRRAAGKR